MLNYADKTKNNNKKINTVNRNLDWKSNLNPPQTAWSWSSAVFLEKIKLNQERGGLLFCVIYPLQGQQPAPFSRSYRTSAYTS